MVAHRSLPAVLPHGPISLRVAEREVVLDPHRLHTTGMRVLQAVEDNLYELVGHQPKIGEQSRLDGPKFIEKPIAGQTLHVLGKTGSLVPAWQILFGWLRTFLASPVLARRKSALWRVLHADVGLYSIRDPRLQNGVQQCKAWSSGARTLRAG